MKTFSLLEDKEKWTEEPSGTNTSLQGSRIFVAQGAERMKAKGEERLEEPKVVGNVNERVFSRHTRASTHTNTYRR